MKVGKGEGKGECTNFREKFYIFPLGRDGGRIFILDLEKILKILDLEKKMTRCILKYKVPQLSTNKKISKTKIPSKEGIEVLEKKMKLFHPQPLPLVEERSLGGISLKCFPNQPRTRSFGSAEKGESNRWQSQSQEAAKGAERVEIAKETAKQRQPKETANRSSQIWKQGGVLGIGMQHPCMRRKPVNRISSPHFSQQILEQRLNLSRSQHKGYSHAYSTSSNLGRIRRI